MTAATLTSSPAPASPSPTPLPVIATAMEAYTSVLNHPGVVARLIGSWLGIGVAVPTVLNGVLGQNSMQAMMITSMLTMLLMVVAMMSIAVGWHRFLLLGEQPSNMYLALDRNVGRYALGALILMLVSWAIMFVAAFAFAPVIVAAQHSTIIAVLATLLAVVAYIGFGLLMWRAAMILPARAIGDTLTIGAALDMTKGNVLRMALATLAVSIPAIVLNLAVLALNTFSTSIIAMIVYAAVTMLAMSISAIAGVGVLSILYRFFKRAR